MIEKSTWNVKFFYSFESWVWCSFIILSHTAAFSLFKRFFFFQIETFGQQTFISENVFTNFCSPQKCILLGGLAYL